MKKSIPLILIATVLLCGCMARTSNSIIPCSIITWIDDDGNAGFYTKLKPFAEKYNIPFTCAIITSREFGGRYMTLEQMHEMSELGCEFISHTHSHNIKKKLTDMTEEELHYEFSTSQQIIKDLGFNFNAVSYPFGAENELVREVASQYYDIGIDNSDGGIGKIVTKDFDRYRVKRVSVEVEDIEEIFSKIDEAAKKEAWIILMSHVDQGDWYSGDRVKDIIEYALNAGLKFVTVEEGFKQFKQFAK